MKKLLLKEGDKIEFEVKEDVIVIRPVLIIDKTQSWFWTKKWQKAEREADEDIKAGRVKTFDEVDSLMKDLEE
jgi:antitoxin component of MazEF toxin-antitoxin module